MVYNDERFYNRGKRLKKIRSLKLLIKVLINYSLKKNIVRLYRFVVMHTLMI